MISLSKLRPDQTMQLQGFDDYSSTALFHNATSNGWVISGEWGNSQLTSFVVLQLWNAQNQFEHPQARYLPDFAFDGVILSWIEERVNCIPLDSALYPYVTWPYLGIIDTEGVQYLVPLASYAVASSGVYVNATATLTLTGTVTVGDFIQIEWLDQHFYYYFASGDTLSTGVNAIGAAINAATSTCFMTAVIIGATITLTYVDPIRKGTNGNRLGVQTTVAGLMTETWSVSSLLFSGGVSPTSWQITIPFSSLVDSISRTVPTTISKIFLTYAPDWQSSNFIKSNFSITATGWTLTDPNGRLPLFVAGEGSIRIEETDAWVTKVGYWENPATIVPIINPFWSQGFAIRSAYSSSEIRKLTITTSCQYTHNIYLGTYCDSDCGQISATLDGSTPVTVDTYGGGVLSRLLLFSGVTAGAHTVVLTILSTTNIASTGYYFYFDFLECAVLTQLLIPTGVSSPAMSLDMDTNNTYMLSPARLLWSLQVSSFVGEIDFYMGVFWWPERSSFNYTYATGTIVFSGTPVFGNVTTITLAGTVLSRENLFGDTADSVATAFSLMINNGSNSFWSSVSGNVIALTAIQNGVAGNSLTLSATPPTGSFTVIPSSSTLTGGVDGYYGPDPTASPVLNQGIIDWLTDFFTLLEAASMSCIVSFSQELVNPPSLWKQRFHDGTPAETATGFGVLNSTQCNFSSAMCTYMTTAYIKIAQLMVSCGLSAQLQLGEILWWYNSGGSPSSMAFYDTDTSTAALSVLGRALYLFLTPNDNPNVNSYADANFLVSYLASYVNTLRSAVISTVSTVIWELLWPKDVNDPVTRQLTYYINLPMTWKTQSGSGFTTFIIEGYQYAGINQNVDQALACAIYPFTTLGWPVASCRYLMGWFYAGWPWQLDYFRASNTQLPLIKLWAWDHYCLFGWTSPLREVQLLSS